MPVYIEGEATSPPADCLHLGLVNNMPTSALAATERQFAHLLDQAATGIPILLSFLSLPSRGALACKYSYRSTESLSKARWDALLVTGSEPVGLDLRAEPLWRDLAGLVEWASEHTVSTIWSCLAAHAAVLHLDGVARQRRQRKISGVFECVGVTSHRLSLDDLPCFPTPHSRWNGLAAQDLEAAGYLVLSRTVEGEVNSFLKQTKSLFLFLQGHPEYEADTLLREYSRDVARSLKGHAGAYPFTPSGYFDEPTESALNCLRGHALSDPTPLLLDGVTDVLRHAAPQNTWSAASVTFYRRWLTWLREQQRAETRSHIFDGQTRPVLSQSPRTGARIHDIDPA